MTESAGFAEMVHRFDVATQAAVDRARRASSDAAEHAETFRAQTTRSRPGTGPATPAAANRTGETGHPATDATGDAALRAAAVEYRRSRGLPVDVLPEQPDEPRPAPRQERKSSVKQTWPDQPPHEPEPLGHDDDDFSQGSIFS